MKRFAVILAGCGVYDGAEIHEAVMALWAIKKLGAEYEIFAPDKDQHHVVNHLTGKEEQGKRNVLAESARIARGKIRPLKELDALKFDALLMPGGFGVAKNLCDFAFKGADCHVDPQVAKAIKDFHDCKKPVGAMCISPVILAKLFPGSTVTIGSDAGTAAAIEKMGSHHIVRTHGELTIDRTHLLFTTPCYMLDSNILQIAEGAENIVGEMIKVMK